MERLQQCISLWLFFISALAFRCTQKWTWCMQFNRLLRGDEERRHGLFGAGREQRGSKISLHSLAAQASTTTSVFCSDIFGDSSLMQQS